MKEIIEGIMIGLTALGLFMLCVLASMLLVRIA